MQPTIGSKLKEKHASKWLTELVRHLLPGETVVALARTIGVGPVIDGVAVTNARVVAFMSTELGKGLRVEVAADDIAAVDAVRSRFTQRPLVLTRGDGRTAAFGVVPDADLAMVLAAVRKLAQDGPSPDVGVRTPPPPPVGAEQQPPDPWHRVPVLGSQPNRSSWKAIKDHCAPRETPWFVLGSLAAGAFAAFQDRCMIVKAGVVPSLGAGSLGGGRITTFPYAEITGIEYNSGLMNGVLEVLTASYSGTSNKDYWRGTGKSINANSSNPFTLSNTLPVDRATYRTALPRLNQMRKRIAESKRPTLVAPAPASSSGLADELTKLAGLRDQGILTQSELDAAKQRVLAQHGVV